MKVRAVKTSIFQSEQHSISFIERYIPKISDNTVLVVTSKIVALSEKGGLRKMLMKNLKEKLLNVKVNLFLKQSMLV